MDAFAVNLRTRARQLGLADAEVARRAGLGERRYAHYVSGKREPDLATLIRISAVLGVTPNDLLGCASLPEVGEGRGLLVERLGVAVATLSDDDLRLVVAEVEAIVSLRTQTSTT